MLKTIVVFLFLCFSVDAQKNVRIVGGDTTDIFDIPYIVSIRLFEKHICGGTIYRSQFIITAAHCLKLTQNTNGNDFINNTYGLSITAGSSTLNQAETNSQYVPVEQYFIHPKYKAKNLDFDIALLKLQFPLSYTASVQRLPVALKKPNWGTTGMIAGWGSARSGGQGDLSNALRSASIRIMSPLECRLFYFFELTDSMICGGYYLSNTSPCLGDSGGPLVVDGKLAGIISFERNCGEFFTPAVFTEVSQMRTFIEYVATHYI